MSITRAVSSAVMLVSLAAVASPQVPLGAPPAESRTLDFTADPGWEGYRNRLVPSPAPITRQDFGHRLTRKAGGRTAGEVGGRIQRSITPAWYGLVIPERSLKDRLSVSGRFAIHSDEGGSGVLFGWFHETSRGWRTSSSLAFRIDGNGGHQRVFYEYGTRGWLTGGGGAFEGERWQDTPTPPLRPDGSSHAFSLLHDPDGAGGLGEMRFDLDGKVYRQALAPGHKEDGTVFNRFGIFNQQITGAAIEVYLADLVLDGRPLDLASDPGWESRGSRGQFEDRVRRPFHDLGWSPTSHAGGAAGEVGGIVWRDEAPAWYAAPAGPLGLEDELRAEGRIAFRGAGSDSAVYLGWFNAEAKRSKTVSDVEKPPRSLLAVLIEGPSRVGHMFRSAYRTAGGEGKNDDGGPLIRPDGKVHRWTISYSPSAAGGRGRITVTFDGEERAMDLEPGHRSRGAAFDRFGFFNLQAGGHYVEVWIDDLVYRAR